MIMTEQCEFVKRYSEIDGLQDGRTVTYTARAIPEGIYMSVKQENGKSVNTEECVCQAVCFEQAVSFLKYIYENSIDLGGWYEVLLDMDVQFTAA